MELQRRQMAVWNHTSGFDERLGSLVRLTALSLTSDTSSFEERHRVPDTSLSQPQTTITPLPNPSQLRRRIWHKLANIRPHLRTLPNQPLTIILPLPPATQIRRILHFHITTSIKPPSQAPMAHTHLSFLHLCRRTTIFHLPVYTPPPLLPHHYIIHHSIRAYRKSGDDDEGVQRFVYPTYHHSHISLPHCNGAGVG